MILDIIIPTLNEADNLKKLLPYIKYRVSNSLTKIIVVDSPDSNDKTEMICGEHDVFYIRSRFSQRAHQLNLGAMESSADALLFLHADVLPPKSFYTAIITSLEKYDCGMFAYRFDKQGLMFSFNAFFTQFDGFFTGGGDQCFFIDREVFLSMGMYDEAYHIMEDFEFFKRVKDKKMNYIIHPDRAIVSSRKYAKHNYLKINWVNLRMLIAFFFGESPVELKNRYLRYRI